MKVFGWNKHISLMRLHKAYERYKKQQEVKEGWDIEGGKCGKGAQKRMWPHRHNPCPAAQRIHSFP